MHDVVVWVCAKWCVVVDDHFCTKAKGITLTGFNEFIIYIRFTLKTIVYIASWLSGSQIKIL
jgi:hypothetical protein